MLSAVEIFNNPNIKFKSETFAVLSVISWTYMCHAYFKDRHIDYHYYQMHGRRKQYDKTRYGAKKSWELERCLNESSCPFGPEVKANLRFLIGLRHEIEHQMTTRIDDVVSAKFQACCLNYDVEVKRLFGAKYSIRNELSFSIQFSAISEPQVGMLKDLKDMPSNISSFIDDYDKSISEEIFNSPQYSYRILMVAKTANHKGQADKVIEFIKEGTPEAEGLNKDLVLIKEREKVKYLPLSIVNEMKQKGYNKFNMHHFVSCWKSNNAKEGNNYGTLVGGKTWYWYDTMFALVEKYCKDNNL